MLQFTHMLLAAASGEAEAPPGQQIYEGLDYTMSYNFIVPANVTSITVLAVAAGAQGSGGDGFQAGPSGGLAYSNNISVTPGETLSVSITGMQNNEANIYTTLSRPSTSTILVQARAGSYGGVGQVTRTGSNGGGTRGGGGGAAGYSGAGGQGGSAYSAGSSGAGGGGGGGAGGYAYGGAGPIFGGGGGGGVGLFGQGSNGAGGTTSNQQGGNGGGGGSGGSNGTMGNSETIYCCCNPSIVVASYALAGNGNKYGGGQGGGSNWQSSPQGYGALRIIWPGTSRQFPNTNVGNY